MKKGISKPCQLCGKEFYALPCKIEKRIFCSSSCASKNTRAHQRKITINAKCPVCKNVFTHTTKSGNPKKYCSNKCASLAAYHRKKIKCVCQKCGNEFYGKTKRKKYCSKECLKSVVERPDSIHHEHGSLHKLLKRNGLIKKCHDCGFDKYPEILGIHHNDKNGINHSSDNLIVLCPNCHSIRHLKHIVHHR